MSKRIGGICKDGTYTTATGRGAGSHHGGIAQWIHADSGSSSKTPSFGGGWGSSNYGISYSKKKQQKKQSQTQKQRQLKKTVTDLKLKIQALQNEKANIKKEYQQTKRKFCSHFREQQSSINKIHQQKLNLVKQKKKIQVDYQKLRQNNEALIKSKDIQKQKHQISIKVMNQKLIKLQNQLKQKDDILAKIQQQKEERQKYCLNQSQLKEKLSKMYRNQIGLMKYYHQKEIKEKDQKINKLSSQKNNLNAQIQQLKKQITKIKKNLKDIKDKDQRINHLNLEKNKQEDQIKQLRDQMVKLKQFQSLQRIFSQNTLNQKVQQVKIQIQKEYETQIKILKQNHLKSMQNLNINNIQQIEKMKQQKIFLTTVKSLSKPTKRFQLFKSQIIQLHVISKEDNEQEKIDKQTLTDQNNISNIIHNLQSKKPEINQINLKKSPLYESFFKIFIILWAVYAIKKLYQIYTFSA